MHTTDLGINKIVPKTEFKAQLSRLLLTEIEGLSLNASVSVDLLTISSI